MNLVGVFRLDQFTAEPSNGTVSACWPLNAVRDTKWHSRRRMSIAPKDVQATIEAIERQKQEEKEKAERIEYRG